MIYRFLIWVIWYGGSARFEFWRRLEDPMRFGWLMPLVPLEIKEPSIEFRLRVWPVDVMHNGLASIIIDSV